MEFPRGNDSFVSGSSSFVHQHGLLAEQEPRLVQRFSRDLAAIPYSIEMTEGLRLDPSPCAGSMIEAILHPSRCSWRSGGTSQQKWRIPNTVHQVG